MIETFLLLFLLSTTFGVACASAGQFLRGALLTLFGLVSLSIAIILELKKYGDNKRDK